jgi:hypothetical protein
MSTSEKRNGRRRVLPAVEQLEDRELLSVTVMPHRIDIHSVRHGHGVFAVRVLSDDPSGAQLIQAASRVFAVGGRALTPMDSQSGDVNGDGTPDLILHFRRRDLRGLARGSYTLTVTDPSNSNAEDDTITLFGHG